VKTSQTEEEEKNVDISEVIRAAPDQNEGKDTKAAEEETAEKAATAQAAREPTSAEAQDPVETKKVEKSTDPEAAIAKQAECCIIC
jgi:hypothetical protein